MEERKYDIDFCSLLTVVSKKVAAQPVCNKRVGDIVVLKYQLPCYTSMLTKTLKFTNPTNALHDITYDPDDPKTLNLYTQGCDQNEEQTD